MPRNSRTQDTLERLDVSSWKDGEISSFSGPRIPNSGLKIAEDVVVSQNGTLVDRGSFLPEAVDALPFPLLGNLYVYKQSDNTENLICMLDNGANGIVYTLSGTAWAPHAEFTFSRTVDASFTQSTSDVVVWNDTDAFSYYDIVANVVKRFTAVIDPAAALTAVKSGLATTGFTVYYRRSYTGNGGETNLSPAYSNTLGLLRDAWTAADYFTLTAPAPPAGAITWALWMVMVPTGSGTPVVSDYELILDEIPVATTVVVDNGKLQTSVIRSAPESNSTAGIIAKYGTNIDGRLWAIHDHTVYWGGDTDYELTFGGARGSGFHVIDQFGVQLPMAVQLGRDNSGSTAINVWTAGIAGQGTVYDVYPNTITVAGVQISGYEFRQREGNDGTNAPFSVIRANNNAYYLSLQGFKSTGVEKNVTGIQSTTTISNAIRKKVQLLTQNDLNRTYSASNDEKLFWTVAYGTARNSQIWVYDILHGGIWTRWNVAADAIVNWAKSTSSSAKLYIVKNQKLLYYEPNSVLHKDGDTVFTSVRESGDIGFKEDKREWVYLLQVLFINLQPVGKVTFEVTAHTKRGPLTKTRTVDFGGVSNEIGWNAISPSAKLIGSHNAKVHNEIYGTFGFVPPKDVIEVSFKFKKLIQYFSWKITVQDTNSFHELSQVVPEFTQVGMGPDMLTRTGTIRV